MEIIASELKEKYQKNHPEGHFFDRETMLFFGDKLDNYGVKPANLKRYSGDIVEIWELFRRKPVKFGVDGSCYFLTSDFTIVFGDIVKENTE